MSSSIQSDASAMPHATVDISIEAGIGVISVDSPPVNALSYAVRSGLVETLRQADADPAIAAIVMICAGRTFFAGADISELGKPPRAPTHLDLFAILGGIGKPLIAAIHGTALGGGLEFALACHYRLAVPSAVMGFPEVKLGILPALGGTQRLPRLIGIEAALDLLTSGRQISAEEALSLGVIDKVVQPGGLREEAIVWAREVADRPLHPVRDREDKIAPARDHPELFADFRRKSARAFRGLDAPEQIVRAVEAAVSLPFDKGLARERELFEGLVTGSQSAALRHVFFAERRASKIDDISPEMPVRPIESVGVIGAGTMGGGIAMNFLNAGLPVTLVETTQEALDRGIAIIQKNYATSARKGRITNDDVELRMQLLTPSLDLRLLSDADLVIEAVYEQMSVKKEIFTKLDGYAKPGAILASNTSFLDLDEIATATSRPEWVVGLHFFSPANVMRLLEVVRGGKTAPEVLATAMALARKIGKVAVLSRVCHGFIANRIMAARSVQANALLLEGVAPGEIDQAVRDFGFAMGPFQMVDLVGLDVLGRDDTQRTVRGDLVKMGRLGQKAGAGFYDYGADNLPIHSPIAAQVIADFARDSGMLATGPQSAEEIIARLLYPVVNEGAKLLEEGIALRASDIDVAAILGYNWPAHTGGPMFWADSVGLPKIVAKLDAFGERFGDFFAPAKLLREKAAAGHPLTSG